jgi:hypothetical protein
LKFTTRWIAVVALVAFSVGALVVVACGGGSNSNPSASASTSADQASLQAVQDQATKAQILAAETVFHLEGMHGLDDTIGAATEIDPNWQGSVTRMRRAAASVVWPAELQDKAATELAALKKLETDLINEDLAAAKADIGAAHDSYHELDSDAYPYIAGETPAQEPSASASPGM